VIEFQNYRISLAALDAGVPQQKLVDELRRCMPLERIVAPVSF